MYSQRYSPLCARALGQSASIRPVMLQFSLSYVQSGLQIEITVRGATRCDGGKRGERISPTTINFGPNDGALLRPRFDIAYQFGGL